jgi:hypothetical protein
MSGRSRIAGVDFPDDSTSSIVFVASRCDRFWCETGAVIALCLHLREAPANRFAGGSVTPMVLGRGLLRSGARFDHYCRRRRLPTKCAKNPRENLVLLRDRRQPVCPEASKVRSVRPTWSARWSMPCGSRRGRSRKTGPPQIGPRVAAGREGAGAKSHAPTAVQDRPYSRGGPLEKSWAALE